ncbi:DMT family transporter [Steroidobacter sp.]|uniref:DMT family transporter n=1 Tax=Steroidobacter sp. TaxID=1978227 RepID=UPI001A586B4A|nr:SMR family transporter [Steroidobacter sp.]MBL8267061.1 QacE family quaternary ammonium compound efflux SMR transporter [Steroidobacter sp.]
MNAWVMLVIAGLLEIGWALGLKATEGFTRPIPTVFTVAALVASLLLLARAVQVLPMGTAYAIWVGIGASGTVLFGILLYGESVSVLKIASLAAVLLGIAGLKLSAA